MSLKYVLQVREQLRPAKLFRYRLPIPAVAGIGRFRSASCGKLRGAGAEVRQVILN